MIIAAALNYASISIMYFWEPRDDQIYVLYIVSCLWGLAEAVWSSQLVGKFFSLCSVNLFIVNRFRAAVYTVLYSETDPSVMAKYTLWKSVGSVVAFSVRTYVFFPSKQLLSCLVCQLCIYRNYAVHSVALPNCQHDRLCNS